MSFSTKDKKILTFLGVFIASVLLLKFFLYPQFKSILKLQAELKADKILYASNLKLGDEVKEVDSKLKIVNQRLKDIRTKFPPVMNYDEVFIVVKNMAKSSGLNINSLNFNNMNQFSPSGSSGGGTADSNTAGLSTTGLEDSKPKSQDPADAKIDNYLKEMGLDDAGNKDMDGASSGSIAGGKGYELIVKIVATGTINQIKSFLNRVENLKCKVIYKNLQISTGDNGILNFNAGISFLGIADSSAAKYTMLENGEWAPLNTAGKSDIFNPYEGYISAYAPGTQDSASKDTSGKDTLTDIQKYDFTMRVVPFSDNMSTPTVSLLAKKVVFDEKSKMMPIVYGDSAAEEKVDLYVEEKNGKFYCKFKTDHEYFPDTGYSSLSEFTPVGTDLNLLVDSTVRKFKNDNSTVLISITNNTKRNFVVKVSGDDKYKSRVKFAKLASNIQVTYE